MSLASFASLAVGGVWVYNNYSRVFDGDSFGGFSWNEFFVKSIIKEVSRLRAVWQVVFREIFGV